MFIQWTTATTEVADSIWREVPCDHCGESYVFRLRARVQQNEVDLYAGRNSQQQARSRSRALDQLDYRLRWKIVPIPCPSCGHYQSDMCEELRRRRYGWLSTVGMFLFCGGVSGLGTAVGSFLKGSFLAMEVVAFFGFGTATSLLSGLVFGLKRWLWSRYDPNVRVPWNQRKADSQAQAMTQKAFVQRYPQAEAFKPGQSRPRHREKRRDVGPDDAPDRFSD